MTQWNSILLHLFSKMVLGDGFALVFQPQTNVPNGKSVVGNSFPFYHFTINNTCSCLKTLWWFVISYEVKVNVLVFL